jgi:hypothetical protein
MRLLFTIIGFQSTSASSIFQPNEEKPTEAKSNYFFVFLNLLECEPDSYLEENWRKKTKDEILLIDNKLSLST